ncbi:MAG: methyltransferase [Firmicutes bacterium]|nr:methyltransferase [Bacillota bacterium]MDY3659102.1 methyltransferase [Eubacteriales bacterium]
MDLKENERLDDLQLGGLKIIQDKTKYCFTSDSAILANFVTAKKSDKVCEIGTGTGVISILLTHKQNPEKIYAFEVQKETAELAKRNVDLNLLNDKIEIINSPIQDFEKYVKRESFDVVVSNPPYRKVSQKSLISLREEEAISKHEVKLNLDELVSCAKNLLKFGGKFFLVYDATRTAELIYKLKQNNLEPKIMFFTSPSPTKNPVLVLIEAVKGGKEQVNVLPTLITNDKDGNYIYTIQNLYGKI